MTSAAWMDPTMPVIAPSGQPRRSWDGARWGRLLEQAAVAALAGDVHGRLTVEQQDRAVHQRLVREVGGVVHE